MTTTEKQRTLRERRWEKSRNLEHRGKYKKAYEIHQEILAADGDSYAGLMRDGWLYYKLGAFEVSLNYYERACALSGDDWALYGIMNCLPDCSGQSRKCGSGCRGY